MTWAQNKNTPLSDRRLLKSETVRKLLGYDDVASFWIAVRAAGIPHIKVNSRRFLFDEAAVQAWLESRTVGKVQS
jgi:predicted DNA-binding transcriptional regulator AlpA